MSSAVIPHPLSDLSILEINRAREAIISLHEGCVLDFRTIYLLEPPKLDVLPFLELEHAGKVTADTPRPARLAQAKYDVIGGSKVPEYHESVIDVQSGTRIKHEIISSEHHASLTMYVFPRYQD